MFHTHKLPRYFFIVLDGFNQLFQASVPFPLTSAVDKSQQHRNKFLGMPRIEPGAAV